MTNSSINTSPVIATSNSLHRNETTKKFLHSPVVYAMLSGNQMNNCQDVKEIYAECLASSSKDRICSTAAAYFGNCIDSRHT
mmetsp:Transcript_31910/g.48224  ORF Transcript_31910/g.48224 Transcript_31910/m.48224 type:complete len:82 (+) Transcript_31910:191-436(+)|eukprot:CAMPEP_0178898720 /NCGR_PEP_ID=MMETSP0786-20121207/2498_1 /TAXON_ID=186022 /ORGANISM="Thalassionema frauenfeldii, Strain CCMP 1798" /LENGTH=81 /DNA_ID=CAMNT_0020569491 /DNA_START=113 /DNA_END=358 /DNA_ORIENTATION=+